MPSDTPEPQHSTLTPLQTAITARARDTLANDERLPKPSTRNKVTVGILALVAVLALIVLVDFSVRVMHHILLIWYPDKPAVHFQEPKPLGPDEPFYITVEPQVQSSDASTSTLDSSK